MKKTPLILSRGRRIVSMTDAQTVEGQQRPCDENQNDLRVLSYAHLMKSAKVEGPVESSAVRASHENQEPLELHSKTEDTASARVPVIKTSLNEEISAQVPEAGLSLVTPNSYESPLGVRSPVVRESITDINGGVQFLEKPPVRPKPASIPETCPITNVIFPDCDKICNHDQTDNNKKNDDKPGTQCLRDCDPEEHQLIDSQHNGDISPQFPETSQLKVVSNSEGTPTDLVNSGDPYLTVVPVIDCTANGENTTVMNESPQESGNPAHILFTDCDAIYDDFESSLTIPVIDCTTNDTALNNEDLPHSGTYEVVITDGTVHSEAELSEFLLFDRTNDLSEPYFECQDTAVAGPSLNNKRDQDATDPDYKPDSSDYSSGEFDVSATNTENNSPSLAPCDAQEGESTSGCCRKRRGRKRKHEEQCHDNVKLLKNSNKTYFNYKGEKIVEKNWNEVQCSCKASCHSRLDANLRKQMFKEFWGLGDYKAQNLFIAASITENPVRGRRGEGARKAFTRTYTLQNVQVCREMFRKTLQISTKRVDTAVKKFRLGDLKDRRGMKQGGENKITDEQLEQVKSHINKLPRYKSHYRRSDTDAEFLGVDMTLAKMYELYLIDKFGESSEALKAWKEAKEKTEKNAMASQVGGVVSFSSYRRIFLKHFNLKFKSLKKDTCNLCDSLAARLTSATTDEEKKALEEEQRTHQELWQGTRNLMKHDQEIAAAKTEAVEVLTFDLEKTLPLPRIPTSIVFYKRQLWLYNAGVHSCRNNEGHCYVWTEDMAGRGAQEIGSCLMRHIENQVGPEIRHLILWSDSCGGQNRNIKMVLMLKCCLEAHPSLETINLKFLVSGHSFLPNDTDFSDIESALSHVQRLYLPEDYMNVMKTARKKKPFIVTKMRQQDFKGTQKLEGMITNRKQGASQEKINWLQIREIKITKSEPFVIYSRPDFRSDYSIINVEKKAVKGRKPSSGTNFFQGNLVPMWENGKAIAAPKLKDLKSLMHLLPKEAKPFYNSLQGSRSVDDDVDGFGGPLDFETED